MQGAAQLSFVWGAGWSGWGGWLRRSYGGWDETGVAGPSMWLAGATNASRDTSIGSRTLNDIGYNRESCNSWFYDLCFGYRRWLLGPVCRYAESFSGGWSVCWVHTMYASVHSLNIA